MARIRYLKPEFFTDEDLAELQPITRLAFAGLWCYADKAGRLEDRPKYLKAMIFPYDDVDMDQQLSNLNGLKHNGRPFIQRYSVNGSSYIQIINWDKHQKPHHTEADSKFPPIPPLKKDKEKIKGMERYKQASTKLDNVQITDRERLKSTEYYDCPYFKQFWLIYPRKEAKGKTWEEWEKITVKKDENFISAIEKVLTVLKQTEQWKKDNGKFIPLPSTWLHQRRWEDEPDGDKEIRQRPRNLFLDSDDEEDGF